MSIPVDVGHAWEDVKSSALHSRRGILRFRCRRIVFLCVFFPPSFLPSFLPRIQPPPPPGQAHGVGLLCPMLASINLCAARCAAICRFRNSHDRSTCARALGVALSGHSSFWVFCLLRLLCCAPSSCTLRALVVVCWRSDVVSACVWRREREHHGHDSAWWRRNVV